jgi:hypothetical protein
VLVEDAAVFFQGDEVVTGGLSGRGHRPFTDPEVELTVLRAVAPGPLLRGESDRRHGSPGEQGKKHE